MAEAIVHRAFLGVGEHGIRLGGGLELFLGLHIARIPIRVVFHGQLPIRALDFDLGRRPRDAEYFVVVPLAHAFATFTIAGRSSLSPMRYPRRNSPMTSPSRWSSLGS